VQLILKPAPPRPLLLLSSPQPSVRLDRPAALRELPQQPGGTGTAVRVRIIFCTVADGSGEEEEEVSGVEEEVGVEESGEQEGHGDCAGVEEEVEESFGAERERAREVLGEVAEGGGEGNLAEREGGAVRDKPYAIGHEPESVGNKGRKEEGNDGREAAGRNTGEEGAVVSEWSPRGGGPEGEGNVAPANNPGDERRGVVNEETRSLHYIVGHL